MKILSLIIHPDVVPTQIKIFLMNPESKEIGKIIDVTSGVQP